eukprot:COSAG01_NODE_9002_length_2586_cov_8.716574_4_plen_94_part_01
MGPRTVVRAAAAAAGGGGGAGAAERAQQRRQRGVGEAGSLAQRQGAEPPARACPSSSIFSIFLCDKNRGDIGRSQSKWTVSKKETAGSPPMQPA